MHSRCTKNVAHDMITLVWVKNSRERERDGVLYGFANESIPSILYREGFHVVYGMPPTSKSEGYISFYPCYYFRPDRIYPWSPIALWAQYSWKSVPTSSGTNYSEMGKEGIYQRTWRWQSRTFLSLFRLTSISNLNLAAHLPHPHFHRYTISNKHRLPPKQGVVIH